MKSRLPTVFLVLGVPFILLVLCFGFYNRVEPRILGFPFVYGWIFGCLFISFLCIGAGWLIDPKSDRNIRKAREKEKTGKAGTAA